MTGLTTQFAFETLPQKEIDELSKNVIALMNFTAADTKKGTHYQSKENIDEARKLITQNVFMRDRALYGCIICMSGAKNDLAKQNAVKAFLSNSWNPTTQSSLTFEQEYLFLDHFIKEIQVNRVLNMFVELSEMRINNSRTRRYALRYVLGAKNFPLWSMKYKSKVSRVLTHCWNHKYKNVLYALLKNKTTGELKVIFTEKEMSFMKEDFLKYKHPALSDRDMIESIAFMFGIKADHKIPLLKAYYDARTDITKGKILPMEIRSLLSSCQ